MRNLKVAAVLIVILIAVVLVVRQKQEAARIGAEADALRGQASAAEALQQENQHLRDQLKATTANPELNTCPTLKATRRPV